MILTPVMTLMVINLNYLILYFVHAFVPNVLVVVMVNQSGGALRTET